MTTRCHLAKTAWQRICEIANVIVPTHERFLIMVLSLSFLVRVFIIIFTPDPNFDSYFRFSIAERIAHNPFDFNINWVFLPFFQYFEALIIWFGGSLEVIRFSSAILGLMSSVIVYKISLILFKSSRAAVASSSLSAINPLFNYYAISGMSEHFFTFLLLLSTYAILRRKQLLAGMLLAISCLMRYEAWFLIPALSIYTAWRERKISLRSQVQCLIPFIAIGFWLLINQLAGSSSFVQTVLDLNKSLSSTTMHWFYIQNEPLRLTITSLLFPLIYPLTYVPVFSVFAMKTFFRKSSGRRWSEEEKILYLTILAVTSFLTLTAIFSLNTGGGRHILPLVPYYLIAGCQPFFNVEKRRAIDVTLAIAAYIVLGLLMVVLQILTDTLIV